MVEYISKEEWLRRVNYPNSKYETVVVKPKRKVGSKKKPTKKKGDEE